MVPRPRNRAPRRVEVKIGCPSVVNPIALDGRAHTYGFGLLRRARLRHRGVGWRGSLLPIQIASSSVFADSLRAAFRIRLRPQGQDRPAVGTMLRAAHASVVRARRGRRGGRRLRAGLQSLHGRRLPADSSVDPASPDTGRVVPRICRTDDRPGRDRCLTNKGLRTGPGLTQNVVEQVGIVGPGDGAASVRAVDSSPQVRRRGGLAGRRVPQHHPWRCR